MQIVYAKTRGPNFEGRTYKNPGHFLTTVEGATKVYIEGDWPKIRQAYEAIGVSVSPIEEMKAMPGHSSTPTPKPEGKASAEPAKA